MELASWQTLLFFTANSIYILAYSVTNIVWLRILTVTAAMITLPYFFYQADQPLWSAIFWQSMFAGINIFHLVLLYIKSLPAKLSELEQQMKSLVFMTLPVSDMRKFLKIAHHEMMPSGQRLLEFGQENDRLYCLLKGGCVVIKNQQPIAHLLPGQFIGEMSFLTDKPASADVVTQNDSEVISWDQQDLNKLFKKHPALQKYFMQLLGVDLADKLAGAS
jgi:hypothetical protein